MKIRPMAGEIQLNIEDIVAGALNTSSRKTAVEFAEVLAVGEGVEGIEKGDNVFVKSWAIDIIHHKDKDYYFVNIKTLGVKAVVQ